VLSLASQEDVSLPERGAYLSPQPSSSSPSLFRSPSVTSPLVFDPSLGRALFSISPAVTNREVDEEDAATLATLGREELDSWLLADSPLSSADVARRIVKQLKDRAEALSAVSRGSMMQWRTLVESLKDLLEDTGDDKEAIKPAPAQLPAVDRESLVRVTQGIACASLLSLLLLLSLLSLHGVQSEVAKASFQAISCYLKTGACAPPTLLQVCQCCFPASAAVDCGVPLKAMPGLPVCLSPAPNATPHHPSEATRIWIAGTT
jgi:hypothetical protein